MDLNDIVVYEIIGIDTSYYQVHRSLLLNTVCV